MGFWKSTTRSTIIVTSSLIFAAALSPGLAQTVQEFKLEQALQALASSLEWQQADLTFQNAQKNLDSAKAAAGLKVNAGAEGNLGFPSSGSSTQSLNLSATASLTVLPWSSAYDQVRNAERALARAKLDRNDTRNTLALNVVNQYFSARISSSDFELAKTNFKLSESQLRVATAQQANGQISKDSFLNAQKNLENTQLNLEQTTNTLEITRLTLFNTLNTEITNTVFSSIPTERALLTGSLDELTAKALLKRSDVQKALSRISDAEDALASAQRDRVLPNASVNFSVNQSGLGNLSSGLNFQTGNLSLTGTVPVVSNTSSGGSSSTGTSLTISANISIPVVAPSNDLKISSAETSLESAKKSLEQTKQTAKLDVRQKYLDAKLAISKLNLAKTSLSNTTSSFATSQARFEAGLTAPNDLEQSRINVLQANRDLEQAVVNQLLAAYRLENAVGMLKIIPGGMK